MRGRATVADFAEREDDFELLRVSRFVGRLRLMPPFGVCTVNFPLEVGDAAGGPPSDRVP